MYKQVQIDPETGNLIDIYRGKMSTLAALLQVRPLKFQNVDREPYIYYLGSQSCSTAAWMYTHSIKIWLPCSFCEHRYGLFITCIVLATAGVLLFRVTCIRYMFNTGGVRCLLYMARNIPRRE